MSRTIIFVVTLLVISICLISISSAKPTLKEKRDLRTERIQQVRNSFQAERLSKRSIPKAHGSEQDQALHPLQELMKLRAERLVESNKHQDKQ